jgi:hypothetical protein
MIPLTAAEARRMFNLHTSLTRPCEFHEYWSGWRRRRQADARKSHYARRLMSPGAFHGMVLEGNWPSARSVDIRSRAYRRHRYSICVAPVGIVVIVEDLIERPRCPITQIAQRTARRRGG